jgi:hypothetical protein
MEQRRPPSLSVPVVNQASLLPHPWRNVPTGLGATKRWRSPRGTIRFAVFFSSSLGDGIEMVEALDEAHAADITQAQFPDAQLKVVPASTIEGKNRHRLLFSWLDTL